jgi:hypothetical protein
MLIKGSPSGERKRNAGVADLGFVLRSQHCEARKGVHVIGPSDENIAASLVADLENKPASQCTKVSQSWRHPLRAPFSDHVSGAPSGGILDIQNIVHFYKHVNMGKCREEIAY